MVFQFYYAKKRLKKNNVLRACFKIIKILRFIKQTLEEIFFTYSYQLF